MHSLKNSHPICYFLNDWHSAKRDHIVDNETSAGPAVASQAIRLN